MPAVFLSLSLFNSSINVLLVVVVVSVSVSVIYDDDGRVGLLWFTSWYEWVSSDHPPSILLSVVSTPSPEWMREKDKQAEIDCGRHGIPCYWLVCWIAIIRPRSSSTQMRTNSVAINDDYRVCVCLTHTQKSSIIVIIIDKQTTIQSKNNLWKTIIRPP